MAELDEPLIRPEYARRLLDARVVFADYELIRADFPSLGSEEQIDAWLLQNAALISEQQTEPNAVNTPLRVGEERILACRPPLYGRSLVADLAATRRCLRRSGTEPVMDGVDGLLDLKGAGIAFGKTPIHDMHGDGLLPLTEAIDETFKSLLIDRVFKHAGSSHRCVPVYAVIDGGFDLLPEERTGAIVVRRAMRRLPGNADLPYYRSAHHRTVLEIELLLRQYGLTSANELSRLELRREGCEVTLTFSGRRVSETETAALGVFFDLVCAGRDTSFDTINVQLTRDALDDPTRAVVVDFSHYRVEPVFRLPMLSFVRDRAYRWGGASRPDEPGYIQARPELAVPSHAWTADAVANLAAGYRSGTVDGAQIRLEILHSVDEAVARLPHGVSDAADRAAAAASAVLATPDFGLEILAVLQVQHACQQDRATVLCRSSKEVDPAVESDTSELAWQLLDKIHVVKEAVALLGVSDGVPTAIEDLLAFRTLTRLRAQAATIHDPQDQAKLGARLTAAACRVATRTQTAFAADLENEAYGGVLEHVDALLADPWVRAAQAASQAELPRWVELVRERLAQALG